MTGNNAAEFRSIIRAEIDRVWTKIDCLEEKLSKIRIKMAQWAVIMGFVVTVGNLVAGLILWKVFGVWVNVVG